jgi:glycosyltransferase involved in cell wall biosynthesis
LPPLEAMACGVPVIAANATSLPEVVGDAGLLFDPADTGALADLMERVLCTPSLAQSMREAGPARAAQFSWARTASLFLEGLRRAVGGRATP